MKQRKFEKKRFRNMKSKFEVHMKEKNVIKVSVKILKIKKIKKNVDGKGKNLSLGRQLVS